MHIGVAARVLSGFDDPACDVSVWEQLLQLGGRNRLFLTRTWLKAWWDIRRQGRLLLTLAEVNGQPVALAPLFASEGMVFFIGAGESDHLDFIGDTRSPTVMFNILNAARAAAPGFVGFRFHLVPGDSPTRSLLEGAGPHLGLEFFCEQELPAYEVNLRAEAETVRTATQRSMLKRENYFRQHGLFTVERLTDIDAILPHLEPFFVQHSERWQGTGYDSPFLKPAPRAWLKRVCRSTAAEGTLRVIRMSWNSRMLGISFAWHYNGDHYSGPWSFAIEHGRHCPGHVLLRHSLLWALDAGLSVYDLRGGDDHYKKRLPTVTKSTQTLGLYPP